MSMVRPPPMQMPKRNITTVRTRVDIPTLPAVVAPPLLEVAVYGALNPSGYFSRYASGDVSAGTLMAKIPMGDASSAGAVPGAPQKPICSNHHLGVQ